MAQSVSLSTTGTATMILNPLAKSTTVLLSASVISTGVSTVTIEMALDDPTILGGPASTWATLSSATALSSFTSLVYTVLSPIGGVRLNSSAMQGSSTVYTLKALQAVTA